MKGLCKEEGKGGRQYILPDPTRNKTVVLCALSAHTLPLITILSHVVYSAFLSRNLACRNLATFSAGVSPGGAMPRPPFFGSIGGGGV